VRPSDPTHAADQRARIEQMIEEYRQATERRLLQRAMTLWLNAEADQRLWAFEAQAERVH
jgi:DNA-binding transcriptional regulator YbjK